jgi:hypothetical protein
MSMVWPDWMSRRRAQKRGPSDAQVVFDVGDGLFQGKGLDVVADVDALVEGLEALELKRGRP